MIIDVAMMIIINSSSNNNEGEEKAEEEAVDEAVDVAKEEDGEAMTVDDGGTMRLRHDVYHSIKKNSTQAEVRGKEDAVLVEVALAVPPPQTPIATWQLQWVRLIYVQLNMQDMNMFMALHLY
jgi:hypothetical protein